MSDKPYDWEAEEPWPDQSTPERAWRAHLNPLQLLRSGWWRRRH